MFERPTPFVARGPETAGDKNHREALTLYGLGLVAERNNRLLEATRVFEKAVKLDPGAVPVHKALIPLYLALDRGDDALGACRKALHLDPTDHETWFLYARQLKDQGNTKEAIEALGRCARCAGLKERPDLGVQVFFDLGVLCEETRDFVRAVKAFARVAEILEHPAALMEAGPFNREEIDAKAAETYERIGRISVQAQQYDGAVAAFVRAQRKDPSRATRLNFNLAKVRIAQDKSQEALTFLDDYLKTQPPGTDGYECKIEVLKKLGRGEEVVGQLQEYSRRDAHNLALKVLLAGQHAAAGQTREAEDLYLAVAAEAPAPDVYRGLFALYKDRRRMNDALSLFDQTVAAAAGKDDRPGTRAAAGQARAMLVALKDSDAVAKGMFPEARHRLQAGQKLEHETVRFLAVLAGRTHQLEDAEALYRTCLQQRPASLQNQAVLYDGLLRVLWEGRKLKEIVEVCQQGLERAQATNRVMFYVDLARAQVMLGNVDDALAAADKAVETANADARLFAQLTRVRILSQADRFDEAVNQCLALLKDVHQPKEIHDIRYELSGIYSAKKDFPHAEEQLHLILKTDPTDAAANNDLGYIWADQGKDLDKAEEFIRKAIQLDREQRKTATKPAADDEQDHAAYLDSLGWVLFRRGELDAAKGQLERASGLADGGDDPVIWDHLGDVYFRLGDGERARKTWQKAVKLYENEKRRKPDEQYRELKRKLQLLEAETQQR